MDVIFIEDRKEFDSIMRYNNIEYINNHPNTILLTMNYANFPDLRIGVETPFEKGVEYLAKYISQSKNVYVLGNVWVGFSKSKNIRISLGDSVQYYINLGKALEKTEYKEYIEVMHDSFIDLMDIYKKINECINSRVNEFPKFEEINSEFRKMFLLFELVERINTEILWELEHLQDEYLRSNYHEHIEYISESIFASEFYEEFMENCDAARYIQGLFDSIEENFYDETDLFTLLTKVIPSEEFKEYLYPNTCEALYLEIKEAYFALIRESIWESCSFSVFGDEFCFYNKNHEFLNISKDILILVGANGVGKSYFLSNISNNYRKLELNVSISNKVLENERSFHANVININSKLSYNEHKQFFENLVCALLENKNLLIFMLSVLENDPLFSFISVVSKIDTLSEKINNDKSSMDVFLTEYRDQLYKDVGFGEFFDSLSDGQQRVLEIIVVICSSLPYVKQNNKTQYWNLLLIDEPENSLHPPYITTLIKIIKDFQDINIYSSSIIATHSPMIVQEFTSDMVRIVRREVDEVGNHIRQNLEIPSFETYGENIGILTDRIFGRDPLNTGFRQTLKDIVNSLPKNELFSPEVREKYIYSQIGVTSLGMEASMVLNGLISSRRKNIELKEKNSEDSR